MKKIVIVLAMATILLASGCVEQTSKQAGSLEPTATPSAAIGPCISLCREALSTGQDTSNGQCISDDNPAWVVENWVCDIAHVPRTDADNNPQNQCAAFREGKAHHFVELDPGCNFIRAV